MNGKKARALRLLRKDEINDELVGTTFYFHFGHNFPYGIDQGEEGDRLLEMLTCENCADYGPDICQGEGLQGFEELCTCMAGKEMGDIERR